MGRFKKTILAIQHLIAMFGATVLVPILTGFDPSVALFTAGLGTLIFHLCTKGKVPVFFRFILCLYSSDFNSKWNLWWGDLAYAQGGMMVAGLIYVLFPLLLKKIGVENSKISFTSSNRPNDNSNRNEFNTYSLWNGQWKFMDSSHYIGSYTNCKF